MVVSLGMPLGTSLRFLSVQFTFTSVPLLSSLTSHGRVFGYEMVAVDMERKHHRPSSGTHICIETQGGKPKNKNTVTILIIILIIKILNHT